MLHSETCDTRNDGRRAHRDSAAFYGVERPFVDTVIVPTTWFEVGAGVHGEIGRGWRYRAFVTSPLDASQFSADEGIRGGLQKGSEANIGRPALIGRLEDPMDRDRDGVSAVRRW